MGTYLNMYVDAGMNISLSGHIQNVGPNMKSYGQRHEVGVHRHDLNSCEHRQKECGHRHDLKRCEHRHKDCGHRYNLKRCEHTHMKSVDTDMT